MRAHVRFCPLVASLLRFGNFSGAVLIWAVLSCRPLSLVLCSCFPSCVASLCLWFCRFGVSACAFAGVFPWSSCSFLCVVGPLCPLCLFCLFGCCRLPSLPVVASLPPAVGPLWRPGPVCTLVPPSGYLVAFVTAWLPCLIAGGVVVLFVRTSFCLMAAKASGPVWGVFYPLHHVACVVRVLSITTLRYSSVMIQVPHWTPLSCTIAILGCNCGILHPCPLLPSRRPLSLSCLWLCLGLLLFGSFRFFMRPPPPPLRRVTSGA